MDSNHTSPKDRRQVADTHRDPKRDEPQQRDQKDQKDRMSDEGGSQPQDMAPDGMGDDEDVDEAPMKREQGQKHLGPDRIRGGGAQ